MASTMYSALTLKNQVLPHLGVTSRLSNNRLADFTQSVGGMTILHDDPVPYISFIRRSNPFKDIFLISTSHLSPSSPNVK